MKFLSIAVLLLLNSLLLNAETFGGRIWVRCIGGTTYEINIHIAADNTTGWYTLDLGDGNPQLLSSSWLVQSNLVNGVWESNYQLQRVYSPGIYVVHLAGDSRSDEIQNIPNSITTQFEISTQFTVDPNVGCNNPPWNDNSDCYVSWTSGQMNSSPLVVTEGEGDSIVWTTASPVVGYTLPSQIGSGPFTYSQSLQNFSWDPVQSGLYTVVFAFEEWHRLPNGNRVLISNSQREILIDVDGVVGMNTTSPLAGVLVYPNPVASELKFSKAMEWVELWNAQGEMVMKEKNVERLDVSGLREGIYFLRGEGVEEEKVVVGR